MSKGIKNVIKVIIEHDEEKTLHRLSVTLGVRSERKISTIKVRFLRHQ